jgi:hypothetical protein
MPPLGDSSAESSTKKNAGRVRPINVKRHLLTARQRHHNGWKRRRRCRTDRVSVAACRSAVLRGGLGGSDAGEKRRFLGADCRRTESSNQKQVSNPEQSKSPHLSRAAFSREQTTVDRYRRFPGLFELIARSARFAAGFRGEFPFGTFFAITSKSGCPIGPASSLAIS